MAKYTFAAPYPLVLNSFIFNEPERGDAVAPVVDLLIDRAMDGTTWTHITEVGNKTYRWDFQVRRQLGLYFVEFYKLYHSELWSVKRSRHSDELIGYIRNDLSEITMDRRAVGHGSHENVSLSIEFETVQ